MSAGKLPPAAAMHELLRDLVGAEAASRTVSSPAVHAVIVAARRLLEDHAKAQRDQPGHDAICRAASRVLASPRLDGRNAAG